MLKSAPISSLVPPGWWRGWRVIFMSTAGEDDRRNWLSRPRQHLPRKPQIEDEENCPDQSVEPHRNPKIDGIRRALDLAAAFERHEPLSQAKVAERPRDHDKHLERV